MNFEIKISEKIKSYAAELGFLHCGIARSRRLDDDARRLENWLNNNYHGSMSYMANHFDLRVDPSKLVPGAKSVITLLMNYYPEEVQEKNLPGISKYAYGHDYHEVIREKLHHLLFRIRELAGDVNGRGFVDSAPVLERSWARESGLGWIGKNGNLINKEAGSFFFLATLITDLELEYDDLYTKDYCGTCTRCIEACPTDAILPDKTINGSQCISYFTIELKDLLIPSEMQGKFNNWMFGCDICQDVCPWNRFSQPTKEPAFSPIPGILNMTSGDWELLGEERFRSLFRHSPLKRSKYKGILRNLRFLKQDDPIE
ncbi:tRNA epoxyqueuosine(34) reductase QueG [Flavihumibacter sp. ZG627]|uniref:tRNA epoxyqueuosine(34) reductase QueG n=1 Tax=Flavihumibacter sp. ZG627 TaxID=1463156 RepID=UPI0005803B8E|nr:tRNA epoxyqueuosine(34) reductase QueG [Flavihumibacter sp. ZG627]KIC91603.1 epoxyqueuosine reductase [Flavihumibacter sp. ZG627]